MNKLTRPVTYRFSLKKCYRIETISYKETDMSQHTEDTTKKRSIKKNEVKPIDTSANNFYIDTDHFDFTHAELAFIRKNLTKRYPEKLRNLVESARTLMLVTQSSMKKKLNYLAELTFTEDRRFFNLSETLCNHNGFKVSIIRTPKKFRENIRNSSGNGLNISYEMMTSALNAIKDPDHYLNDQEVVDSNGSLPMFFATIEKIVQDHKDSLVVYACHIPNITTERDRNDQQRVVIALGHTEAHSHMVEIVLPIKLKEETPPVEMDPSSGDNSENETPSTGVHHHHTPPIESAENTTAV